MGAVKAFLRHRILDPIISKPVFLVIPLFIILLIFFWLFESRKLTEMKTKVPRDLDAASIEIENQIEAIINYLEMVAEESAKHELSKDRFVADATRFVKEHPEVMRVVALDARMRLKWVAPEDTARVFTVPFNRREISEALPKASESGVRVFTRPFVAINGEQSMAIVVPPAVDDPLSGPFYAVLSLESVLENVVPSWVADEYALAFLNEQNVTIAKYAERQKINAKLSGISRLQMGDVVLKLLISRYDEGIDWQMVMLFAVSIGIILGVSVSVIELARDNKRKQRITQELARAKDMAESASAEKSKFLANMSHEIRTPIGAIIGYADMILAAPLSVEEKTNFTRAIHSNSRSLLRLVNDILDLSKVEAGLLDVCREDCPIGDLINEVLATVRPQTERKGLSLSFAIDGAIPERVQTDPLRLRQIFLNVLANAVKFTDQGHIQVRAAWEEGGDGRSLLQFRVADTGIGIDANDQAKIFQNFIQADSSIAKKYGGTGLGLALSRRLAELLGGYLVLLRSARGEGSEFAFAIDGGDIAGVSMMQQLPDHASANLSLVNIGKSQRLAGLRVMVVEDVLDNRVILKRALEAEGAQVDLAQSGLEAIQHVDGGGDYDVIVMDIQMPILDGYQTTRALRDGGFTRPIVALTAHAMRDDREKCLEAGCNEYLSKPVDFDRLIGTIRSLAQAPLATELGESESVAMTPESNWAVAEGTDRLVSGFMAGLPERMQAMALAWEASDVARMLPLVHKLKGTAGLYGFAELSQCCHQLEEALRAEPFDKRVAQPLWDRMVGMELRIRQRWQQTQCVSG